MAANMALVLSTLFVAVLISFSVVTVSSTLCYTCHLAPRQNHCMDAGILAGARHDYTRVKEDNGTEDDLREVLLANSDYMSECGNRHHLCVIERILVQSEYKLMYRDCSDGLHFSTNVNGTRLENPPTDNNTHCAYQNQINATVCITLCQGDFCNGPVMSAAGALRSGWLHTTASVSAAVMAVLYFRSSVVFV